MDSKVNILVNHMPNDLGNLADRMPEEGYALDWDTAEILACNIMSTRKKNDERDFSLIVDDRCMAIYKIGEEFYQVFFAYQATFKSDGYVIARIAPITEKQYKGCILQLQAPAILNPVDPNTYTITNKDEDTVVYVKYVAESEDKSEYEVFYHKLVK